MIVASVIGCTEQNKSINCDMHFSAWTEGWRLSTELTHHFDQDKGAVGLLRHVISIGQEQHHAGYTFIAILPRYLKLVGGYNM